MDGSVKGCEITATLDDAKSVRAIDKSTVHRICSGQVIHTLATAVKELIENSLDAGATIIEIRLREYGGDLIEVTDNGSGVEPSNFEGLALKHHTSKLESFEDLSELNTFGFRGEALSSLCALSELTIYTKHRNQKVGKKLVYDKCGKLVQETSMSRQVGTTVSIGNIFSTLPVRYKEFQRNIKKEFNRLLQVLYGYSIISTGIRLSLHNKSDGGASRKIISTDATTDIKENICALFGTKQVSTLLEIKLKKATAVVLDEYNLASGEQCEDNFKLSGYISTCAHGSGRSAPDRQFYFVNGRPCDPSKVSRLVNKVYRQFNPHQYPAVVLIITTKKEDVDVNLTPDKRQIMITQEKLLLATLKTTLLSLFEVVPSMYNISQKSSINTEATKALSPSIKKNDMLARLSSKFAFSPKNSTTDSSVNIENSNKIGTFESSQSSNDVTDDCIDSSLLDNSLKFDISFESSQNNSNICDSYKDSLCSKADESKLLIESHVESEENNFINDDSLSLSNVIDKSVTNMKRSISDISCENLNGNSPKQPKLMVSSSDKVNYNDEMSKSEHSYMFLNDNEASSIETPLNNGTDVENAKFIKEISSNIPASMDSINVLGKPDGCNLLDNESNFITIDQELNINTNSDGIQSMCNKGVQDFDIKRTTSKSLSIAHSKTDDFMASLMSKAKNSARKVNKFCKDNIVTDAGADINGINPVSSELSRNDSRGPTEMLDKCHEQSNEVSIKENNPDIVILDDEDIYSESNSSKKRTVVINVTIDSIRKNLQEKKKSKANEQEKKKTFCSKMQPGDNKTAEGELQKQITKDMFSKMKIIGQFNLGFIVTRLDADLFIIDQHATDEKYNFETLQNTCVLQKQKLMFPQKLQLSAVSESILLSNQEIFNKNGFEFSFDDSKSFGQRISLTSLPYSKGWEFNKEDVDELIFMLSDVDGVMCRPSRVRDMFASRSCRMSVMIGSHLSSRDMRRLVDHMGEIDQPWNCPHGRPTMRHLINIDRIRD